jgi:hypothetical protein
MRPNQTIVRFQDGRVIKGYTYNLNPSKYHFHLFPIGDASAKGTEVWLRDVKAVFFTRDLTGDPEYRERKDFEQEERPGYRRVRVIFADGEMLCGYTTRYDSGANGFYFVPADAGSNNLRVFAVFAGVREIAYVEPGDGEAGAVAQLPDSSASATV